MKALIIGIDAASPVLIQKWIEKLPNLRYLSENGVGGILESVVPPASVPAWQCFATGKNPAKIGVFGFTYIGRDRRLKQGRTTPELGCLWDLCSKKGLTVGVLNVPGTYPPYPVEGFMVSGFPVPPGKVWAYPSSLMHLLDSEVDGYEVDVPLAKPSEMKGGEEAYLSQVDRLHRKSLESAKLLVGQFRPDVFIMTLQGLDLVQHDFWQYMDAPESPYTKVLLDWYVKMDEAVGELRRLADPDTYILVLSDHGSAPVSTSLYINEQLRSHGLLVLRNDGRVRHRGVAYTKLREIILRSLPPEAIKTIYKRSPGFISHRLTASAKIERTLNDLIESIDWEQTLAFSTGGHEAAIYLNSHLQQSPGSEDPGSCPDLVRGVCSLLSELKHPVTGERLRSVFHFRENTFQGPYQDEAPDLCVELFAGEEKIQINPKLGTGQLWSLSPHFSATHVREGFWAMMGPGIRRSLRLDASILDATPTLLKLLKIEGPLDMDGKVLGTIVSPS